MSLSLSSSSSNNTNRFCRWVDTILQEWPFSYETRHGTIECPCGRVKYNVSSPPSSFAFVEQTTAICHCTDCVGFVSECPNSQYVLTKNHGTHMIQFYSCDIQYCGSPMRDDSGPNISKKGGDEEDDKTTDATTSSSSIGAIKLRENTPLVRVYCRICGTPIGAQIPSAGICLVYDQVLTNYSVCFLPSIVLGFKERLIPVTKPYSTTSVTVRQSNFGFIFLCRVISRVILGLLLGKKITNTAAAVGDAGNDNDESLRHNYYHQGLWPFGVDSSSIPVGLGSIAQNRQQQRQQQHQEKKMN